MYRKYLSLQQKLRKNMPTPEILLWTKIRDKQLGAKFRRQYAIENRILDFYAPSIKLGIEIDGETHFVTESQNQMEQLGDQALLARHGITIIRFLNTDLMKNLDGVLETIVDNIESLDSKSPT